MQQKIWAPIYWFKRIIGMAAGSSKAKCNVSTKKGGNLGGHKVLKRGALSTRPPHNNHKITNAS